MSWDPEFEAFMPETITLEPTIALSGFGAQTPGAAKTIRCRIEQEARKVTDREGKEVVSQTRLYLKPTAEDGTSYTIAPTDRITLPAGFLPQQPPILSVSRQADEAGLHHYEVAL